MSEKVHNHTHVFNMEPVLQQARTLDPHQIVKDKCVQELVSSVTEHPNFAKVCSLSVKQVVEYTRSPAKIILEMKHATKAASEESHSDPSSVHYTFSSMEAAAVKFNMCIFNVINESKEAAVKQSREAGVTWLEDPHSQDFFGKLLAFSVFSSALSDVIEACNAHHQQANPCVCPAGEAPQQEAAGEL